MKQANKFNKKYGLGIRVAYDGELDINDEISNIVTNYIVIVEKSKGVSFGVIVPEESKMECLEYIFKNLHRDSVLVFSTNNEELDALEKMDINTGKYRKYQCDIDFIEKFGPFFDVKKMSLKDMFASESEDDEPEDIKTLRKIKGIRRIRKIDDDIWEFHID